MPIALWAYWNSYKTNTKHILFELNYGFHLSYL
jgi:hypothetical protein